jgi:hypothetical protein
MFYLFSVDVEDDRGRKEVDEVRWKTSSNTIIEEKSEEIILTPRRT